MEPPSGQKCARHAGGQGTAGDHPSFFFFFGCVQQGSELSTEFCPLLPGFNLAKAAGGATVSSSAGVFGLLRQEVREEEKKGRGKTRGGGGRGYPSAAGGTDKTSRETDGGGAADRGRSL